MLLADVVAFDAEIDALFAGWKMDVDEIDVE